TRNVELGTWNVPYVVGVGVEVGVGVFIIGVRVGVRVFVGGNPDWTRKVHVSRTPEPKTRSFNVSVPVGGATRPVKANVTFVGKVPRRNVFVKPFASISSMRTVLKAKTLLFTRKLISAISPTKKTGLSPSSWQPRLVRMVPLSCPIG